jgi:hypothetical protein
MLLENLKALLRPRSWSAAVWDGSSLITVSSPGTDLAFAADIRLADPERAGLPGSEMGAGCALGGYSLAWALSIVGSGRATQILAGFDRQTMHQVEKQHLTGQRQAITAALRPLPDRPASSMAKLFDMLLTVSPRPASPMPHWTPRCQKWRASPLSSAADYAERMVARAADPRRTFAMSAARYHVTSRAFFLHSPCPEASARVTRSEASCRYHGHVRVRCDDIGDGRSTIQG